MLRSSDPGQPGSFVFSDNPALNSQERLFHKVSGHQKKPRSPRRKRTGTSRASLIFEGAIIRTRGHNVILDTDLAQLYEVETRVLVQAVKRNVERFPEDFMFQLTPEEFAILRSQSVTSSEWGGRRYPPYAFTEQGVAMLSSVLRSKRAVQANIEIMRAFVRLRRLLGSNADLQRRLDQLEKRYDERFRVVFDAIRQLMAPPDRKRPQIGFRPKETE